MDRIGHRGKRRSPATRLRPLHPSQQGGLAVFFVRLEHPKDRQKSKDLRLEDQEDHQMAGGRNQASSHWHVPDQAP